MKGIEKLHRRFELNKGDTTRLTVVLLASTRVFGIAKLAMTTVVFGLTYSLKSAIVRQGVRARTGTRLAFDLAPRGQKVEGWRTGRAIQGAQSW